MREDKQGAEHDHSTAEHCPHLGARVHTGEQNRDGDGGQIPLTIR